MKPVNKDKNQRNRSEKDANNLPIYLRSKYLAYEEAPKEISDKQRAAKQRVAERHKKEMLASNDQRLTEKEEMEKIQHEKLIGQLKAAEARNRIRVMRLRHHSNRVSTEFLISMS
jgi:hypothetical protein